MNWGDFTIGFMAGAGVLAMLLTLATLWSAWNDMEDEHQ